MPSTLYVALWFVAVVFCEVLIIRLGNRTMARVCYCTLSPATNARRHAF